MNNFTPEDLIRYLYGEMSPVDRMALDCALEQDWKLMEELNLLRHSHSELGAATYSPRPAAVAAILSYADSLKELQHS